MTDPVDLNAQWETAKPVLPGGGLRVQPNTGNNTTPLDQQWDAAKPVTPDIGTKAAPVPVETAPTLGEAASGAVKNFIPSIGRNVEQMVEGVGTMVQHPIETAKTIGKLALSASPLTQLAGIALPTLDPDQQKQLAPILDEINKPGSALGQQIAERYGGWDKFKKTLKDDPAGILMDIGSIASGGEMALARSAPRLATVAGNISKLDPINLAMKGVGPIPGLEAAAKNVIPRVMGARSGLGQEVGTEIRQLHEPTSPYGVTGRAEFQDAFTGNVAPRAIVERAEQGVANMKRDAGLAYNLSKDDWSTHGGTFNFNVIDQAERDLRASLHTPGGMDKLERTERRRVQRMFETVDQLRSRGPSGWTIEELDGLKQRMQNVVSGPMDHPQIKRASTTLKNAVLDQMVANAPPSYRQGLANYHAAMNDLDEMRSSLSLGKDASDHTVMSKLQSVLRNNAATQYGSRMALVDQLEREGGVQLRPWLLGMAANTDAPRGITGAMSAASNLPGLGGAGLGYATMGPWGLAAGIPLAAADMFSRSPRMTARVARGIADYGDDIGRAFPLARYTALHAGRERERENKSKGYAEGGTVESDFIPLAPKPVQPRAAAQGPDPMLRLPELPKPPAAPADTLGDTLMKVGSVARNWGKDPSQETRDRILESLYGGLPAGSIVDRWGDGKGLTTQASLQGDGSTMQARTRRATNPEGVPISGDSYEDRVGTFESGNTDAVNAGSGAAGLFQFLPSTAEGIRKAHPELEISDNWRKNRDDQRKLMKVYTDNSKAELTKLGHEITGGKLYLMHLLGQGGGAQVLSALDDPVNRTISAGALAGNPWLKDFSTGKDLLRYLDRRFG